MTLVGLNPRDADTFVLLHLDALKRRLGRWKGNRGLVVLFTPTDDVGSGDCKTDWKRCESCSSDIKGLSVGRGKGKEFMYFL